MAKDPAVFMAEMMNRDWESNGLHCWALTRLMVKECFGVDLPLVTSIVPNGRTAKADLFNKHEQRKFWKEVYRPDDWGVALMSRKGAEPDLFEHSGVYLNMEGGIVFHVDYPHGCVADSVMEIKQLRKWETPRLFVPL